MTKPRRENEPNKSRGRGRPLGSILFVVLFLLVVVISLFQKFAPQEEDRKITVGEFHERLLAGEILEFRVSPDGEVRGTFVDPPSKKSDAKAEAPKADGVGGKPPGSEAPVATNDGKTAEEIKAGARKAAEAAKSAATLAAAGEGRRKFNLYYPEESREKLVTLQKKLRRVDGEPWALDQFSSSLTAGTVVANEAILITKSDDAGKRASRLFVDLVDSDGAPKYVEVKTARVEGAQPEAKATELPSVWSALRAAGASTETFWFDSKGSVDATQPNTLFQALLPVIIPWAVILLILWFLFIRQMRTPGAGGGILGFGRSRAVLYTKENRTNVTFDDVAGIDEAKEEVKEVIEFLKNPQRFARLGGRIPRGILLVGPPGTGKTLLAKAIAGEAEVPFFSISGSDFVEMFVGVGASRVRDLFKQAKENAPCIIFLDEIDAVGRKRGSGMGGGHDEREQTLNAILVEMDGFDTNEGIIVCAATNRPDVLDPALLRPGRFDREVVIDPPDYKGREEILKVHARRIKVAADVEMKTIARSTPSFSGADLAALMNEAAIIAVLKKRDAVTQEDLEEARDKVRFGRQKKSRVMIEEDRIVTARHEAGHAVVASLLPGSEPVHKVTIIPRGMALGSTMRLPETDRLNFSKRRAEAELCVLYGGRIAEGILGDDVSSGASNDIQRATELARMMVCEWGFSSKVGPLNYAERIGNDFLGSEFAAGRFHSEMTAREIDEEVQRICADAYGRAKTLLEERRPDLERVTQALLHYETITGAELHAILAGKPLDSIRTEPAPPATPPVAPAVKPRVEAKPKLADDTSLPEAGLAPA